MSDKLPITIVLPTRNEARNLPHCLDRLEAFAQVWIVDSASTDATREIARDRGHRVIDFEWSGGFPKKRNWVLMNEAFDTPWVLFLDADEHITPEFVEEARRTLPGTDHAGFWLTYRTHFMGKVLRHGLPQRKLALFRPGAGFYERINDPGWSHLDMEVHEHPVLEGSIGTLQAPIDHLDYRGMEHFIARHNAYSNWEANRYMALRDDASGAWERLTGRQKMKYRALERWWFAPAYFAGTYFGRGGFLDGAAGFDYALLKMNYFQQIRIKIAELREATTVRG